MEIDLLSFLLCLGLLKSLFPIDLPVNILKTLLPSSNNIHTLFNNYISPSEVCGLCRDLFNVIIFDCACCMITGVAERCWCLPRTKQEWEWLNDSVRTTAILVHIQTEGVGSAYTCAVPQGDRGTSRHQVSFK